MLERFENLISCTSRIYKSIHKIKQIHMGFLGMKGNQAMCIFYLSESPEGLYPAELCAKCGEDKAGISRILKELEEMHLIEFLGGSESRRYRARAVLTEEGQRRARNIEYMIAKAGTYGSAGLTEADKDAFDQVLSRIADNLEAVLNMLPEVEESIPISKE